MARPEFLIPSDSDPAGWGFVPSVGGDINTAIPDPGTGVSQAQTDQAVTTVAQAIPQAVSLPPAPTVSPLMDQNGYMSQAWVMWFNQLSKRVGGYIATPADDAQVLAYEPETVDRQARSELEAMQWDVPVTPQSLQDVELWGDASAGQDVDYGRWDDLRMGEGVRTTGANIPALSVFRGGLRAYEFPDVLMKEVFLQGQMSHAYKEGSDIHLHLHWGHISGANAGNIVWNVEYAWTNIGEAMPAPTTVAATAANVLAADQYKQQITSLVTISGAGKRISSILTLRVFRDPATDTSTASGFLFEVDAHYQRDHNGSIGMTTKY